MAVRVVNPAVNKVSEKNIYAPAGVSTRWLKSIAPVIKEADLWQTGGDLISAKSGIIMHPLGDRTERAVARRRPWP